MVMGEAHPNRRWAARPRASAVRRLGRFRGTSKGEASGAVGSGRDGASSGGASWGNNPCNRSSEGVTSAEGVAAEAPGASIWERSVYTSLGHPDDFRLAAFVRLLRNGIPGASGLRRRD